MSEAQVDEKIIPAIADLDVPLVVNSRQKLKRSGSLFFSRYKLRFSADEDAGETVVRRVKRQLNKHCIRS